MQPDIDLSLLGSPAFVLAFYWGYTLNSAAGRAFIIRLLRFVGCAVREGKACPEDENVCTTNRAGYGLFISVPWSIDTKWMWRCPPQPLRFSFYAVLSLSRFFCVRVCLCMLGLDITSLRHRLMLAAVRIYRWLVRDTLGYMTLKLASVLFKLSHGFRRAISSSITL